MRDDDNSDACDEAPRAEDKCYTRGRLRDEFRMKPAPGAEPVKMYKNPYGGKYGVWRLADCIPMRDKRPQTEKQQLASAASQAGLSWSGQAHSAPADAAMTAGVVSDIARYWSQLQREMRDDTGE
ncbi:hypothetical protein DP761_22265 [Salmonella enterica subsp. enterica]|nr:hypothetical protein [Salmonella enterica subsp. enterica serovar Reading]MLO25722.1 hypothetical protein [Salmonella enterica subsp. enterica serovar Reading]